MQPYEIIGAPLTLWLAPSGTAFPLIGAAPAGTWVKVGTNGTRNYSGDGVTVAHGRTFQKARPAGATGPIKAFLDEEELMIRLTLWDLTLEQYQHVLSSNTLSTTVAGEGTAGFKKIGLSHGMTVKEFSLLARGESPYDEKMVAQYEVPRCYQSGTPEIAYRKAQPAGLALEFTALEDLAAANEAERFGRLVVQHQAPLP
ncbi:hypothetical protein SAMN02927924_01699 [Sphingobium faniae]|nr:hypothetical protein SAMN02927924_01699 [Sphingobium faniae]